MHRFEEDPVVPAFGAPPGAAGPEDLQHRRPILLGHPRQHGRLLPNRPAKCHRSTNVGIHSPHTQPNPSTRPRTRQVSGTVMLASSPIPKTLLKTCHLLQGRTARFDSIPKAVDYSIGRKPT